MKKLLYLLFFFALATAQAQELTPDMLVGEYEGYGEVKYGGSDKPFKDKNASLSISKIEGDTLILDYKVDDEKYDVKAYINNKQIIIFHNKVEDKRIFKRYTSAENYEGDIVQSNKGEYLIDKGLLRISFSRTLTFSDDPEISIKYFYLEMKKKQ